MIWQLAGQVGLDPSPFTFWELATMAEGRSRERWAHTATAVWIVAEVNRSKKKRAQPFTPDDFNPYERRKRRAGNRLTVGVLQAWGKSLERANA